mgnify:CR=1 FL=1
MRLAIAASTMDSEPLLTKLLNTPSLNIVGISHPDPSVRQNLEHEASIPTAPSLTALRDDVDVQAVVLAPGYSPNDTRGEDASISIPCATFLSSGNTRFVFNRLATRTNLEQTARCYFQASIDSPMLFYANHWTVNASVRHGFYDGQAGGRSL